MLNQRELKQVLSARGLRPAKRLGQNFLIDANIKNRIIEEARLKKEDVVLEIGAGLGALTFDLAGAAGRVYSVERDRRLFEILKGLASSEGGPGNLHLICDDILDLSIKEVAKGDKLKVVGNLPYCVTTPIITFLIDNRAFIDSILITVQKEVAARLTAGPGGRDYGSISCLVRYYTEPSLLRTIRRGSFYPAPEVDSTLVRLDILKTPRVKVKDEGLFFSIIRKGFNQRRKVILNALSHKASLGVSKEPLFNILEEAGIDASARAEDLGLEEFARLANLWPA